MGADVVAVMQPYFFPYAGYYRLLAAADTFVVFDDVQFPRRGRVHRCEVPGPSNAIGWLTLPLDHQPRETTIRELHFARDARRSFDERLARLTWLRDAQGPLAQGLRDHLTAPLDDPCSFIVAGIRFVAQALGLKARIVFASELSIERTDDRVTRILSLVRAVGGTTYLNSPGGRTLYDDATFSRDEVALRFLEPYRGSHASILQALATQDPAAIRMEILRDLQAAP